MYLASACTTFLALASLVGCVPSLKHGTPYLTPSERGLKWKPKAQRRSPLTIIENVQETDVIIVEENLGEIAALEQLAEQEFAALIEAQLALITVVEDIKDNIRINDFSARFSQVDTVIVVVSTIVDARPGKDGATRYMVKQLLADNGIASSQVAVMVSDASTMTIGGVQTGDATAISAPTGAPLVAGFDSSAPYGQLNQSQILPVGAQAPQGKNVVADPAAIILAGQNNLFVESVDTFVSDCSLFSSNADSLLSSTIEIFSSYEELSASQAGSVTIIT